MQRSMMAPRPVRIAAFAAATHCCRVPFGPLPFRLGPATVSCRAQHSIFLETPHHSTDVLGTWLNRCLTGQQLLVQSLHSIRDLAWILSCQERCPCKCPTQRMLALLSRPCHCYQHESLCSFLTSQSSRLLLGHRLRQRAGLMPGAFAMLRCKCVVPLSDSVTAGRYKFCLAVT